MGLEKIYFTTENINIFIQKCENAFEHLQCITQDMYPNLNEKSEVKVFKDVSESFLFTILLKYFFITFLYFGLFNAAESKQTSKPSWVVSDKNGL